MPDGSPGPRTSRLAVPRVVSAPCWGTASAALATRGDARLQRRHRKLPRYATSACKSSVDRRFGGICVPTDFIRVRRGYCHLAAIRSIRIRRQLPCVPPGRSSQPRRCAQSAKREPLGLVPEPEADRHTLLRRVTIDLTGLPPTAVRVLGILPDGVDAVQVTFSDGTVTSAPVTGNVYVVEPNRLDPYPLPMSIAWQDATGKPFSLAVPLSAEVREPCATTPPGTR